MIKQHLESYMPMISFISEMTGPDAEVILYDVSDKTVYAVINPFDDEMCPGSPMRSLERDLLEKHMDENENYIVNYRALTKGKHKLKSATMFLKDDGQKTLAVLTVNINVERLVEMRDYLNVLVSGHHPYDYEGGTPFYNSFEVSVEGMVSGTIKNEVNQYGLEPQRLSQREKLQIVRALDQKGIFLVKGAIGELAAELQTTETTIYRYLNKLPDHK